MKNYVNAQLENKLQIRKSRSTWEQSIQCHLVAIVPVLLGNLGASNAYPNENNFDDYNANINRNVHKKLSPEQQSENINLDGISKNTKKANLIFYEMLLQSIMITSSIINF